jgi:hypothetical protein
MFAFATQFASAQLSVTNYGAKCNWNGSTGTDDTAAFQAAATAASNLYSVNGSTASVLLPAAQSCVVGGTVTIGSGVLFEGPGTIVVPGTQMGPVLQFQNADKSGVENLTINILNVTTQDNPNLSAILWVDTSTDSTAHSRFFAKGNAVLNGSYGISVFSSNGSGSLDDVDISNNSVTSSSAYKNSDGIHVDGNVHFITISSNRVSNRGNAALAITSGPGAQRTLSGAVISNNTCFNNITGLDNSGGTNAIWSNNYVIATAPVSNTSNPAARSIPYVGITPVNVKFIGNYLQNYQGSGTDFAAKIDDTGSNQITNVEWAGNTIVGTAGMWLMANTAVVRDNFFSPGSKISVEYDATDNYPGQNIMIGKNYWMGTGTISAPGNPALYSNNSLAPQQSNGPITIVG